MAATPRTAGGRHPRLALAPAALIAAVVAALFGLAYLAARETSLFALREVEVRGAGASVAREVRKALAPFQGTSLVSLSADEAVAAVERVPAVRSAEVDRHFPHGLRVDVVLERPVAVVRQGTEGAWLVASSGRVLGRVDPAARGRLPRIWLPVDEASPVVGRRLAASQGAAAVRAVAAVPKRFPARVVGARGTADDVTLVLAGKTELRLGELRNVQDKLAAAAAVLRRLDRERADPLTYLDVTVPTRPVGKA